jgi:hypothetical protein
MIDNEEMADNREAQQQQMLVNAELLKMLMKRNEIREN